MQPISARQAQDSGIRAPEPVSVLEILVVDAESSAPISGAKVELFSGAASLVDTDLTALALREVTPQSPGVTIPVGRVVTRSSRSSETTTSGKVVFRDVIPGDYRLDASAEGYIPERQGQRRELKGGKLLKVSPASKTEVVLRLSRGGQVSGAVVDVNARAIPNLPVYLLLTNFTVDGERSFVVVKGATTDSLGRFTIPSIGAGKYFLAAGRAPASFAGVQTRTFRPTTSPEAYRWAYYPGSSEQSQAAYIAIAGNRFDNVQLIVAPDKLHSVKGRIDFGPQTPLSPLVTLYGLAPFEMAGLDRKRIFGSQLISDSGQFEFPNLSDGTYSLAIRLNSRESREEAPAPSDDAFFEVKVNGADIDGLNLNFSAAGSVRGSVRVADGMPLNKIDTNTGRLQIGFARTNSIQPDGFSVVSTRDGSFVLKGISGKYRVSMPLTTSYIAEIRLGGEQAMNGILDISPGYENNVEILLKTDGGSVSGQIVNELSQPLEMVQSGLLLPSPLTTVRGFYRRFSTNPQGQFKLGSIPPGNYRLFVWKDIDPSSYFDPELIDRSSVRATAVRVSPRSQETVIVKIISQ